MKLSDIHDEIHPLLLKIFTMSGVSESDKSLVLQLNEIFEQAKPDEQLNTEYLDKIKEVFDLRWNGKKDFINGINETPLDYFRNNSQTSELNHDWLDVAKIIATHAGIGYLEILVPSIQNVKIFRTSRPIKEYLEPINFIVLDDKKSLYPLSSLEKSWATDRKLCIEFKDEEGFLVERPLTLMEIYRILKKHKPQSSTYLHPFAEKLWCEIVPSWRRIGNFPRALASSLIELIIKYFEEGEKNAYSKSYKDYPEFTKDLRDLYREMQTIDMADIYHFYADLLPIVSIGDVEDSKTSASQSTNHDQLIIAALFFQLLKGDMNNIRKKMESFAVYLSNQDLSYIVPSNLLTDIYQHLGIGLSISKTKLAQFIGNILESDGDARANDADELNRIKSLLEKDEIQLIDAVKFLQKIYQKRWERICAAHEKQMIAIRNKEQFSDPLEQLDYTRKQNGENYWWIKVAQLLAGANLLNGLGYIGYYQFLMPSLQDTKDNVYSNAIETYHLNRCILSEDTKTLIPLELSKIYYQNCGEFLNINSICPRSFTTAEKLRVIYASEQYHTYITVFSDPPALSKKCVNIFRELVESILSTDNHVIISEELIETPNAGYAYGLMKFYSAMKRLSDQEKLTMLSQKVAVFDNAYSVAQIIKKIRRGQQDGCVSTWGRCLAQLVMDYERWRPFSQSIENSPLIQVSFKRQKSARRVYSDYDSITQDEAILRNRKLMISLLTFDFKLGYGLSSLVRGDNVSLWDCSNRVNETMLPIFNLLKSDIEPIDNNHQYARDVYVNIMEGTVLPILSDPKQLESQPPEVRNWLNLVKKGTLFKNSYITYYHPQTLFVVLQSLKEYETFTKADRQFIQDLLYTILKPFESDSMRWVRANVLYFRFLKRQKAIDQKLFISMMRKQSESDLNDFYNAVYEFYAFQAAERPVSSWLSLFVKPDVDEKCRKLLMDKKPVKWTHEQWWEVKDIFEKNLKAIKAQA